MTGLLAAAGSLQAGNAQEMESLFARPSRDYSTSPLWVWNDMLTAEQIVSTMRDLAGQQVKQVFVHPRPGLMTPYLSDDWFRLWKVALQTAETLDMNVWIYDENSYPSGFAGGLVPEAMPESRGRGLVLREGKQPGSLSDEIVAVFRLRDDGYENVTEQIRSGQTPPDGDYLAGHIQYAPSGGWFGGKYYVDLLHPGVTEKFLEITLGAYQREVGDQFGRRLPGVFTDEPHLAPAGGLHWTVDLESQFQKRWGYSLVDHLPSLVRPLGDWKRVRHNYHMLLLEMFIDRWARPCYEYCEKHDLEFTGHYWEHGWPGASHGGDNMAMYAWHQRPAIDCLMNQYSQDVHAQFGNLRAVKELSSVANQLGRQRTLCEAYGAGGWDLRFEDMKRIGDWLYVLGVNTLDEHLSYVTIRGARKRDHPQSFSYHEPWWQSYHVMAEYFSRLSVALAHGREVNGILVIEPTSTAWMYQGTGAPLEDIGNRFQRLITGLSQAQIEYDLGCEDIIARHGRVEGGQLVIGQRRYRTVVITPLTENLNQKTARLLEEFLQGARTVLCCGDPPERIDGQLSPRPVQWARQTNWRKIEPGELVNRLAALPSEGLKIRRAEGDRGILYHQRRRFDDGELLFLVNTSITEPTGGAIESAGRGIRQWDPTTGGISPYPHVETASGSTASFRLAPCGSLLLFVSRPGDQSSPSNAPAPTPLETPAAEIIPPATPLEVRRLGLNVLTLDYVDITAGGQTKQNLYFYAANRFAFQQNGMDRNPWDSAVQLHDEMITHSFPADSGFEARYRFTVSGAVPGALYAVIERPDLYLIRCNGKPVAALEGQWWLDRAFGKIDISETAQTGENVISLTAAPMTIYHELESAYILGDFSLRPTDAGFAIEPARPLRLGAWNKQGHPFYAAGVAYGHTYDLGQTPGRYRLRLPHWYGSVARVVVNGKSAGHIAWQPWQCDLGDQLQSGKNTIEVEVIGTLRNTLGPHHNGESLGSAWPAMFQKGPAAGPPAGSRYSTVGYGLLGDFELCRLE
ncbi:MAG: hypothetical protein JW810_04645 [Sedimentisphaerales bacterium]|nr:hypothetical protein [Sedimentisphaerales bacterium]